MRRSRPRARVSPSRKSFGLLHVPASSRRFPSLTPPAVSHPSSSTAARPLPPAAPPLSIPDAEALIASLPGVISARILELDGGGVGDVHVLTSADVVPKQTVRNVESALLAHFGVRVDHRKISVATTSDGFRARSSRPTPTLVPASPVDLAPQRVMFEDVEVRRSSRSAWCRVTLRRGEESVDAEAETQSGARARTEEIAARATLSALGELAREAAGLTLEGAEVITAFDRDFVFVGVTARQGRGASLLTGSCEVRESVETAAALAVLDATNRWVARAR